MKTFTIRFCNEVSPATGHTHRVQATKWDADGPWIKFFGADGGTVLSAKKDDIVYIQDTTTPEGLA